jgi:hypothetical protein
MDRILTVARRRFKPIECRVMSTTHRQSQLGINVGSWHADGPPPAGPSEGGGAGRAPNAIWLDGDVLACACPECGSPMSIRLWLMLADCWRCGASVELTEEQEREAIRLLEERERRNSAASIEVDQAAIAPPTPPLQPVQRPPAPPSPALPPAASHRPAAPPAPVRERSVFRDSPAPRRTVAAQRPSRVRQDLQTMAKVGLVRVWARELFRSLPAWLTSLIFHMVALILLGLWLVPVADVDRHLILATQVGPEDQPGDLDDMAAEEEPLTFEDPGHTDPQEDEHKQILREEGLTLQDDLFNPLEEAGELPGPELLQPNPLPLTAAAGAGTIFMGRDPAARAELVRQSGGTIASEAAVARGLVWLSRHQNSDGHWSLSMFHRSGDCRGRCGAAGQPCDTAATGLGLLPFLGAGQTHLSGDYTQEVNRALIWLIKHQKDDGNLWTSGMELSRMYAHAQATIALCEAYALTKDSTLREPAQKAVNYILKAQHSAGGWRYYPGSEGDMSVVGWQLMALRSGQIGGLDVPQEAFDRAASFLDSVQKDSTGSMYAYQPGHAASATMTAEALLCRQYGGWPRNHPGLQAGARYLIDQNPPSERDSNMYYWYYATQMMHHLGGKPWEDWNHRMRDLLVNTQETEGHAAGSWKPVAGYDPVGGRLYMTALAVCTLEVYYRHLPLYQHTALESPQSEAKSNDASQDDESEQDER